MEEGISSWLVLVVVTVNSTRLPVGAADMDEENVIP